jgi:hypothetical protein
LIFILKSVQTKCVDRAELRIKEQRAPVRYLVPITPSAFTHLSYHLAMKFRDGMWQVAAGMRPEYAEDVYSITQHPAGNALSLLCPTKKILARADSLNLPTLTIVSASM